MNDLTLLIAEINKNLPVLQRIRDFIDTMDYRDLVAAVRPPFTTVMMTGSMRA